MEDMNVKLQYIKQLVSSPKLMDATDADAHLEKLSVADLQGVMEYCSRLYEMTGDRRFKFAYARVKQEAEKRNDVVSADTAVSSYLQDILNSGKLYPIARRPGHPDGENQNSPNRTTG